MKLWRSVLGLVFGTGALLGPAVAAAHSGHTMQEPWQVCEDATLSDACAWANDAGDLYVGTCREVSDTLLCVRNKPIVKHGAHEHEHGAAHEDEAPEHGDHEGSPPPLEAAETLVTDAECPNAGPSPLLIGGVGLFGVGLFGLLGLWGWSRERRASSTLVAALGLLSVTGNSGCRGIEEPAAQQPSVETPVAEAGLDATAFATAPTQTEYQQPGPDLVRGWYGSACRGYRDLRGHGRVLRQCAREHRGRRVRPRRWHPGDVLPFHLQLGPG